MKTIQLVLVRGQKNACSVKWLTLWPHWKRKEKKILPVKYIEIALLGRPWNKTYLNYSPSSIVRPTASSALCYYDKIRGQYLCERVIRGPCYEIVIDDYDRRYVPRGMGYWMSGNGVVVEWLPSFVGEGS
ncbi:hypothetical protein NPIL_40131 [Nephila pilipes]|uniref:Uncharacterized protein n=1 Tax=Nephila pilipes TaxID=299642 RepID=A0A8X6Q2L4_NEPPI|nr:hypothetical protein NPIL_40131 [Nephila pilipes]